MDKTLLLQSINSLSLCLDDNQINLLARYYDMVVESNKVFNLTAIIEEKDFAIKHFQDSLAGVSLIPQNARLLDIGSGAGFPSMPIAIVRDDITVVALDSTAKKMTFVSNSAKTLGVKNISTVSGRAEEQKDMFGTFDVVTARAVSALPILLELAMPMLKVGGIFIAYKTDESELETSQSAMKVLGAKHVGTKFLSLDNGEKRALISFEKTMPTPKQYPRVYGSIKKKPL